MLRPGMRLVAPQPHPHTFESGEKYRPFPTLRRAYWKVMSVSFNRVMVT